MFDQHGIKVSEILKLAGLRPTRQRIALGKLLWPQHGGHQHITAEELHKRAEEAGEAVSLATVYNTLHQFRESGLLGRLYVDSSCAYFDTNVDDHHHFYFERTGRLVDVPSAHVSIENLPYTDEGHMPVSTQVLMRVDAD